MLEAMALGVVLIVANYVGPAELVTDRCGYKVELGAPEVFIENIRATVASIVENPANFLSHI